MLDFGTGRFCQKCHDPECWGYRSPWMPLPPEVWRQEALAAMTAARQEQLAAIQAAQAAGQGAEGVGAAEQGAGAGAGGENVGAEQQLLLEQGA
jgi:hypothetical protein